MSGYYQLLAEKIIQLKDYTADEVIDGQPLPPR
jgi:spore germination protein YaaH